METQTVTFTADLTAEQERLQEAAIEFARKALGRDIVAREREELGFVVAEVLRKRRGVGQAVAGECGETGAMAVERNLVAPLDLHQGSAPVEENGAQHAR